MWVVKVVFRCNHGALQEVIHPSVCPSVGHVSFPKKNMIIVIEVEKLVNDNMINETVKAVASDVLFRGTME